MADKNIGALVLVERGTVVGIVSERDCARKLDLRVQITKNLAKSPGNDELIDLSCRTAAYEVATAKWRAGPDPLPRFEVQDYRSQSCR